MRRGLRDHRRAPLAWGLPLGAMCALIVGIYPSIQDSLNELTKNYPEGLKQAFGIEQLDSAEAYLDAEMFSLIVPLTLAFFAVRSISREISVAEERGYLDTTLAAPLSRRVLVAGLIRGHRARLRRRAGGGLRRDDGRGCRCGRRLLGKLAAGVANVWPLAVFSAGLAVLVAGSLHRSAPVTAIATGTLVGMYVVDLAGKLADAAEPFRWVTVFKYYGSGLTDGIDLAAFIGVTAVRSSLAFVGSLLFERRDVLT